MKLSNRTYDTLKWVVGIFLPALGALYAGLAVLWNFPRGEEVVGSIALLATFLGALIIRSSKNYDDDLNRTSVGPPAE